jgi:aryl-alcohol dehydrogenase-like predicted oxidoreductase
MLPMCDGIGVDCVPVLSARQGQAHPPEHADRSVGRRCGGEILRPVYVDQPVVDAVQRVAESRGIPMSKVALAWLLAKPSYRRRSSEPPKPHHLETPRSRSRSR